MLLALPLIVALLHLNCTVNCFLIHHIFCGKSTEDTRPLLLVLMCKPSSWWKETNCKESSALTHVTELDKGTFRKSKSSTLADLHKHDVVFFFQPCSNLNRYLNFPERAQRKKEASPCPASSPCSIMLKQHSFLNKRSPEFTSNTVAYFSYIYSLRK